MYLELDTRAGDMTILNVEVPATEYTVQPCPEDHLSFSMKLMVMALQLYQDKVEKVFVLMFNMPMTNSLNLLTVERR